VVVCSGGVRGSGTFLKGVGLPIARRDCLTIV
jgi:hypothetical protein